MTVNTDPPSFFIHSQVWSRTTRYTTSIIPDLTLTFDPATLTLVQILALIYANLMCEIYQDSRLLLATTKPKTFVIVGYKTLLGGTLAVVALQKQWQIRGVSWFRNGTNVVEFFYSYLVTF